MGLLFCMLREILSFGNVFFVTMGNFFFLHCFAASQRLLIKLVTELKTELKEVRAQVQLNTALLQSMQTHTQGMDDDEPQLPDGVELPFATLEDFVSFDEELKTNKAYRKYLVRKYFTSCNIAGTIEAE